MIELSAVSQAKLLAKKELSALELTNLYLDRIDTLNPKYAAFSYVAHKKARSAAQQWDHDRARNREVRSVLSGIPIGIKDINMVRWMPAQMGSRAFKYFVPPFDDPNVARLRKAGMIIVGKTATSEFGATPFSTPQHHPPTRNPWDPSRTPGGSSGGSAAAVAARMIPLGHAADGGGSIRIPAALCGLIGFKPSRTALHHVVFSDQLRIVTEGPIARTLEDIAAFSSLLAVHPEQFQSLPPPHKTYRIVFHTQSPLVPTDPEIVQVVQDTAKSLAGLGHHVEEGPWSAFGWDDFMPLWCRTLANIPVLKESCLEKSTRWFRQIGKNMKQHIVKEHLSRLQSIGDAWWGKQIDFHLSPTVSCLAPPIHEDSQEDPSQTIQRMLPLGAYTAMVNFMGYAAITLPVAYSRSGLPIGIQLIARQGHDAALLALSNCIKQAHALFQTP